MPVSSWSSFAATNQSIYYLIIISDYQSSNIFNFLQTMDTVKIHCAVLEIPAIKEVQN